MTHRVYFEVIFRDIPRSRFTRTTVYQPKSREPGLTKTQEQRAPPAGLRTGKFSCEPGCQEPLLLCRAAAQRRATKNERAVSHCSRRGGRVGGRLVLLASTSGRRERTEEPRGEEGAHLG